MNRAAILLVAEAKEKAEASVDYSPKDGAVCPVCGKKKIPIQTSRPWVDNIKIRYHKCNNVECVVSHMGMTVKSVQVI